MSDEEIEALAEDIERKAIRDYEREKRQRYRDDVVRKAITQVLRNHPDSDPGSESE